MTTIGSDTLLAAMVVFCRVGGCLMLMVGFSSSRIPAQIRLVMAIAVSLAITPLVLPQLEPSLAGTAPLDLLRLILLETATGSLLGLAGRMLFLALETMAGAIASATGYAGLLGPGLEEGSAETPLTSLVMTTATVLVFVTDQHVALVRALATSYSVAPPVAALDPRLLLVQVTDRTTESFLLALRIAAPFLVYGVTVNFATGLINKMIPQVPVYFVALPFVLAGGLILLAFVGGEMMHAFAQGVSQWLAGL